MSKKIHCDAQLGILFSKHLKGRVAISTNKKKERTQKSKKKYIFSAEKDLRCDICKKMLYPFDSIHHPAVF